MTVEAFPNPEAMETLGDAHEPLREEIGLLTGAGTSFDRDRFLAGERPGIFGSALTNFGVGPFLDAFYHAGAAPRPRHGRDDSTDRRCVLRLRVQDPTNMDRKHRDRMAFLRICSADLKET